MTRLAGNPLCLVLFGITAKKAAKLGLSEIMRSGRVAGAIDGASYLHSVLKDAAESFNVSKILVPKKVFVVTGNLSYI